MATRRAIKAINWSGIAERLHEEEKTIYAAFKSKSDQYLRKVQQFPEKSPAIDWTFYQKHVTVPGMVDNFKKQYDALSIPYPKDSYTEIIDAQAKAAEAEVKNFIDDTNKDIEELNKKIMHVKGLMPFSEMTWEDVHDLYPDICLDPVNRPSIWPHGPEDQIDNPQEDDH